MSRFEWMSWDELVWSEWLRVVIAEETCRRWDQVDALLKEVTKNS